MQKYPIGIQDFEKLRKNNFLYVDKTEYIYKLTQGSGTYFLSRPRRFGKSLLVSTIEALFDGKKTLFEDTFIYNKWDWETVNPVIKISFNNIGFKELGLPNAINLMLDDFFNKFNIDNNFTENSFSKKFKFLIETLSSTKGKVVILIDEYDKAIIEFLGDDIEQAKKNRDTLKIFYSVLKDADSHIRMLFLTGISKFSKVSIFSDLNHLKDLTMHHDHGGICGITEAELKYYFVEELKVHNKEAIKKWYNGYTWDRITMVYNPFSLLNYFDFKEFFNFWYQSGSPTFLWKILSKAKVYDIKNIEASYIELDSYDIEKLEYIPLLYQTGYITFDKEIEPGYFTMRYPNMEVEQTFNRFLWKNYSEISDGDPTGLLLKMRKAFNSNDLTSLKEHLNSLFQKLPYDFFAKEKEVVFHAMIHLTFVLLNEFVLSEVHTHKGRCDSMVFTNETVFAFEFKMGESASIALNQIKEKGYLDAYKNTSKKLIAVGVNYNKASRLIDDFLHEEIA